MSNQERRKAQRIRDDNVSLKFLMSGFDTSTHTINISASGLYCKVDKELPLMSRVHLMLMLPGLSKGVEVDGVVVRAHPVIIDGRIKHYDVAIFFDNLDQKTRDAITEYIDNKKAA